MGAPLKHISPRTKILLFSTFLVLLPGAILSYLGFRSITEKAGSLATTYRGTVTLVRDRIESSIIGMEKALYSTLPDQRPPSTNPRRTERWLETLEGLHPGLSNFFLVNSRGGVLSTMGSFGWAGRRRDTERREISATDEFRTAEELEFIIKDYAKAADLYRKALANTSTAAGRSFVLSRIGRCYFKMTRYREGIAEYRRILLLDDDKSDQGAVHPYVVALSQIADGYASLGKGTERDAALIALYERLLYHPWDLQSGEYSYYLSSTIAAVDSISQRSSVTDRTTQDLATLRRRESQLLTGIDLVRRVHQTLVPQAFSRMNRENPGEALPFRIPLQQQGSIREVTCVQLPPSYHRLGISMIGYSLDEEYFVSSLLPRVLGPVDLGKDLVVGILDPTGTPRYLQKQSPATTSLISEHFSQAFPQWQVALFHLEGKTIEELVGSEKNLYLFLFLGIVGVMVIGIVVIGRAALHEMEAARIKSDFVSNVSHELKTPLALIRMFGETLEAGLVSDEERRQEFYRIITKESERLTHLINNVLNFSKLETGNTQYHFEEDDIARVVRNTLEAYRFHIRTLGFELTTEFPEDPVLMRIDKDAISQAVLNLLNNSVKYSDRRKFIRVALLTNAEEVLISIEDRGVGIPPDEIKKIFDKFYRATTTRTRETTGSGLGLTLVRHIVEAHGGSVQARSTLGEGSVFVLRLPRHCT